MGQRFIVILDADDGCDRSEDFLAGDTHIVRRLGEQRRLQIEAGRVTRDQFTAEGELRALLLADGDVVGVLIELALIDHGADMGAGFQRIVDEARCLTGLCRNGADRTASV